MTELLSWGMDRSDQVLPAERLFAARFKASQVTAAFPSEDVMQPWCEMSVMPMTPRRATEIRGFIQTAPNLAGDSP